GKIYRSRNCIATKQQIYMNKTKQLMSIIIWSLEKKLSCQKTRVDVLVLASPSRSTAHVRSPPIPVVLDDLRHHLEDVSLVLRRSRLEVDHPETGEDADARLGQHVQADGAASAACRHFQRRTGVTVDRVHNVFDEAVDAGARVCRQAGVAGHELIQIHQHRMLLVSSGELEDGRISANVGHDRVPIEASHAFDADLLWLESFSHQLHDHAEESRGEINDELSLIALEDVNSLQQSGYVGILGAVSRLQLQLRRLARLDADVRLVDVVVSCSRCCRITIEAVPVVALKVVVDLLLDVGESRRLWLGHLLERRMRVEERLLVDPQLHGNGRQLRLLLLVESELCRALHLPLQHHRQRRRLRPTRLYVQQDGQVAARRVARLRSGSDECGRGVGLVVLRLLQDPASRRLAAVLFRRGRDEGGWVVPHRLQLLQVVLQLLYDGWLPPRLRVRGGGRRPGSGRRVELQIDAGRCLIEGRERRCEHVIAGSVVGGWWWIGPVVAARLI
ncbi:hypothetical protein PENTCL1PPCAC_1256, partial [Pristionchus entomophagus]